jgi:hypothetical protein
VDFIGMEAEPDTNKTLSVEQLADLRDKTEVVAQFLHKQLRGYLETLRPLLAPRRLLGKYVGVKEDIAGADRAWAQLQGKYKEICGKPLALPPELDEGPLAAVDSRLDLYPWEYTHQAKGGRESKAVTITSPLRWVLNFSSTSSLSQLIQTVSGKDPHRSEAVRQFVVNGLVMHFVLAKFPGVAQLLTDLRFEVRTERSPALGDLPLVTVTACVPAFLPTDELILTATRLSGVPAFIELADIDAVHTLEDPLRQQIEELLR